MKTSVAVLIGSIVALLVLAAFRVPARYTVSTQGAAENPLLVRLDTWTGKSWYYSGGWIPMPDAPAK